MRCQTIYSLQNIDKKKVYQNPEIHKINCCLERRKRSHITVHKDHETYQSYGIGIIANPETAAELLRMSPWFFPWRGRVKRNNVSEVNFMPGFKSCQSCPVIIKKPLNTLKAHRYPVDNPARSYHRGLEDGLNSMLYRKNVWIQPLHSTPRRRARFEASPAMRVGCIHRIVKQGSQHARTLSVIHTYMMCSILTKFCFFISKTDLRCSVVSKESLFPGYKEDNKHQYRFPF